MRRLILVMLALTLTALALPGRADATIFRGRAYARPAYRPYTPANRMPGWDWQRTYPYSAYNYGRNPYNPIIVPYVYPYSYPYVYPQTYPVYSTTYSTGVPTIPAASLPPIPPVPPIPAPQYYRSTRRFP